MTPSMPTDLAPATTEIAINTLLAPVADATSSVVVLARPSSESCAGGVEAEIALDQAVAATPAADVAALQARLERERTALAVQRATAEQARRVADCLRAFQTTLFQEMSQPCLALDGDGIVTLWNPALAAWSSVPAKWAEGKPLSDWASPAVCDLLAQAIRALLRRNAVGESLANGTAVTVDEARSFCPGLEVARFRLLPLCRIPGCVEAVVVLLEPRP